MGRAGDNDVDAARKNYENAVRSGDAEFLRAATNRLRNTSKRAGKPILVDDAENVLNRSRRGAPQPNQERGGGGRDPRVVGRAGDNDVDSARKNLENARKSGDPEFIKAATNRLMNTENRAARAAGQELPNPTGDERAAQETSQSRANVPAGGGGAPGGAGRQPGPGGKRGAPEPTIGGAPEDAPDAVVGDKEFVGGGPGGQSGSAANVVGPAQQPGELAAGELQQQRASELQSQIAEAGEGGALQQGGQTSFTPGGGASGFMAGEGGLAAQRGQPQFGDKGGEMQPGTFPTQSVPGRNQAAEYNIQRSMSTREFDTAPAGIFNMPNGQVEKMDDGRIQVRGLSERGKARLEELVRVGEKSFGNYVGRDDPNAPKPPIVPGMPAFNPDTGKWSQEDGESVMRSMGGFSG